MILMIMMVVSPSYRWRHWASEKLNYLPKCSSYLLQHNYLLKNLVALNNNSILAYDFASGVRARLCWMVPLFHLALNRVTAGGWAGLEGPLWTLAHSHAWHLGRDVWRLGPAGPLTLSTEPQAFPRGLPIRVVKLFIRLLRALREWTGTNQSS